MAIETGERIVELFLALLLGVATLLSGVAQQVIEPGHQVDPLEAVRAVPFDCAELQLFGEPLVTPEMGEVDCGSVQVPENWSEPEGRQISLSYAVLKSTSPDPKPDPILYLEGGPGGSSLTGIDAYAGEIFDEMRQDRDIVLFDQRGTRFSSPLKCSLFTVEELFEESTFIGADDGAAIPELTPVLDEDQLMKDARLAVGEDTRRCVHEITSAGVDLRQYNSAASGNDAVALMNALGYRTYNLFGISYGTRLALVIMRDHPNAGVRATVLDSSFPPEIPGFERFVTEAHEVVMQLFSDCRLDPVCDAAYPNLKERFKTLLDNAEQTPIQGADGTVVTALDLVNVVTAISSYTASAAYIPRMIYELEDGDTTTYNAIVSGSIVGVDFDEAFDEAEVGGDTGAATAEEDAAPAGDDVAPDVAAQDFILSIQARASQLPQEERDDVLLLLGWLDKVPRTRDSLITFVEKSFEGADQAENRAALLNEIDALSDDAVQQVFDEMEFSVDIIDIYTVGLSEPVFNSVECNEEAPFEDFSNAIANAQALEIPELAFGTLSFMAQQFATCELWPSGRAREIEARPVVSDIPTLVMAGNYDFQTPISWNRQAFVNLSNSYYVEFPASGHGVVAQSQCAKDVAREFIDTPFRQPNSACTADLWPIWAMPGDQ